MGDLKMGILDDMFNNALKVRNKDYIEKGYIRVNDINPDIRWFGASFFFMVLALFFAVWYVKIFIVIMVFLLSRSFFRGMVKL